MADPTTEEIAARIESSLRRLSDALVQLAEASEESNRRMEDFHALIERIDQERREREEG